VSRRASEESSASGGASSDRPVGGAHGYSWLRPLARLQAGSQRLAKAKTSRLRAAGRAEDQICHG
jgi:hypothetical protein